MKNAYLTKITFALISGMMMVNEAPALEGDIFVLEPFGTCKVRARVYGGSSADVTMQVAGDPTSGGSLWINGKATAFKSITAKDIASCGYKNVSELKQNGASGTFASDDYVGFSFKGTYAGRTGLVEMALVGAKNTVARFKGNKPALSWVPSTGGTCSAICNNVGMDAVSSGTYKNGKPFYVCSANAHNEGDRAGYNLEPSWAKGCVVGWGGKEISVSASKCLCKSGK